MWEKIEADSIPELREPVLLVLLSTSLPQYRTMYSQARELSRFLLKKMDFEKLATIYSSALPPTVMISDEGIARLVSVSIYRHKGATRDILMLAGDSTPLDAEYEFSDMILRYARELGVHELISVGARWTEAVTPPSTAPRVLGFATDIDGVKTLEAAGASIMKEEPAPYFASLIVGLAERYGMRGYKLCVDHGEPAPHPRSVIQLISILSQMLKLGDIGTEELEARAKEMTNQLRLESTPEAPPRPAGVYG